MADVIDLDLDLDPPDFEDVTPAEKNRAGPPAPVVVAKHEVEANDEFLDLASQRTSEDEATPACAPAPPLARQPAREEESDCVIVDDSGDEAAGDAELLRPVLGSRVSPATPHSGRAVPHTSTVTPLPLPAFARATSRSPADCGENTDAAISLSEGSESDSGDDDYFEELAPAEQARRLAKKKEDAKKKRRRSSGKGAGSVAKRKRVGEGGEEEARNAEEKARKKEENEVEKARKASERAAKLAEKSKALENANRASVAQFLVGASRETTAVRGTVEILLPKDMTEGRVGKQLAQRLEFLYPGQVVVCDEAPMVSSVCWRCRTVAESGGVEKELAVVVFSAESFCDLINSDAVEQFAMQALNSLAGKRVELVLMGVEKFCRAEANRVASNVRAGDRSALVTDALFRDACMLLWMEYNMTTHRVNDELEKAEYLIQLTERIAKAPHRKTLTFLDVNLACRQSKNSVQVHSAVADASKKLREAKASTDFGSIWTRLLVAIPGVSRDKADAVRRSYPTLQCLLTAYNNCSDDISRDSLLEGLEVHRRGLGPVLSKRIAFVLTSPESEAQVLSASQSGES